MLASTRLCNNHIIMRLTSVCQIAFGLMMSSPYNMCRNHCTASLFYRSSNTSLAVNIPAHWSVGAAFWSIGTATRHCCQYSGSSCCAVQVYAPTFPGYGRSEKPAVAYSQELWRDFLRDFVVEVVRRPVVVAGNSIGGFIAASLAADHRSLVQGSSSNQNHVRQCQVQVVAGDCPRCMHGCFLSSTLSGYSQQRPTSDCVPSIYS